MKILLFLLGLFLVYYLFKDTKKNLKKLEEENKDVNFVMNLSDEKILNIIDQYSEVLSNENDGSLLLGFLLQEKEYRGL